MVKDTQYYELLGIIISSIEKLNRSFAETVAVP